MEWGGVPKLRECTEPWIWLKQKWANIPCRFTLFLLDFPGKCQKSHSPVTFYPGFSHGHRQWKNQYSPFRKNLIGASLVYCLLSSTSWFVFGGVSSKKKQWEKDIYSWGITENSEWIVIVLSCLLDIWTNILESHLTVKRTSPIISKLCLARKTTKKLLKPPKKKPNDYPLVNSHSYWKWP